MFEYFKNLVNNRQSCRNFNDKPLSMETIDKITSLSMLAPSACNSQPWKMYVVTDAEKKKEVACCLQDGVINKFLDKAQAFILLAECEAVLKPGASEKFGKDHFIKYDIGQLSAYITLAAESLGVSSCIIGWVDQEALRKAVSMPKEESCAIAVALGYSDIPKRKKMRKSKESAIQIL